MLCTSIAFRCSYSSRDRMFSITSEISLNVHAVLTTRCYLTKRIQSSQTLSIHEVLSIIRPQDPERHRLNAIGLRYTLDIPKIYQWAIQPRTALLRFDIVWEIQPCAEKKNGGLRSKTYGEVDHATGLSGPSPDNYRRQAPMCLAPAMINEALRAGLA